MMNGGFKLPLTLPTQTNSLALLTATQPVLPTQTSTPPPASPSPTVTPTITSTPTLAPPPTVNTTPTVLYPDGNLYTLLYNETSFYMINRSFAHRSISGFTFQRLDPDGLPMEDIFQGHLWQSSRYDYLPRNFCVDITIYGDQDPPYLNPTECTGVLIKTIQPRFDRPTTLLFWTSKNNSSEFRVIWLDEEVARCSMAAGACDVYIP